MTAQLEELVPYSNWPDIQDFLPDSLQPPLDLVARSNKFQVVGNPGRVTVVEDWRD